MKNRPGEEVNFKSIYIHIFHFQEEVHKPRCMFWKFKSKYVKKVIYFVLPL